MTAEQIKQLKEIKNYFGTHDRTPFQHRAYNILEQIIVAELNKPAVEQKYEVDFGGHCLAEILVHPNCIAVNRAMDERGESIKTLITVKRIITSKANN